jgi:hypothetical protein
VRLLTRGLGLAFAGLLGLSGVSAAQKTEIDIGVMGGLSLPTNEAANLYVAGWNAGGTIRVMPANWPVGLQFDGVYASYNRDEFNLADRGMSIITGALSVIYQVELDETPIEPYFLAGVTVNNLKIENARTIENYGSATKAGLTFGGGVAFKSEHARIAPLVDFRLYGIFGSDPREGAYINFNVGFLILLQGRHSAP